MIRKKNKMEMMEFDPPIKSRFLPGEISELLENVDLKKYKEHRLLCANAKAVIDNKPPKFNINIYYNKQKLYQDEYLARLNFKQRTNIMKSMNLISRHGGKVDCWNLTDKKLKMHLMPYRLKIKIRNNKVMQDNKVLHKELNSMTEYGEYSPQVMAKCWKTLKGMIEYKSRFPWYKEILKYPSITHNAPKIKDNTNVHRTRCFFDLELAQCKLPLGRIVFELYNEYVPMTCANFEAFCKGFNGLSYKGTPFHCIISGYWCQGGDVTKYNGVGGASIFETPSSDEHFTLQHSCPGVLSTYSDDKTVFDSKFHLSFRPLKSMDGRKVVFGKVITGIQNMFKIDAYGTKFGKPLQKIIISNCGVLELKKHNSKNFENTSAAPKLNKVDINGIKKRKI